MTLNPLQMLQYTGGRRMSWWQRRLILRMFAADLKPRDIEFIATVVYLAEKPPLKALLVKQEGKA